MSKFSRAGLGLAQGLYSAVQTSAQLHTLTAVQYSAVQYSTVQYRHVMYCTMQYSTTRDCTPRYIIL
jgi:hypothetical protein